MPTAKNPNGARTDAERRAQNKWEQKNRVTLGVRLSKADGEAFRAWCADRGLTVNAALSVYVAECLRPAGAGKIVAGAGAPQKCADVGEAALQLARSAAAAEGEDVGAFLARAIRQTADTDERTRRLAQAAPARTAAQAIDPAQPLTDQLQQRLDRLRALRGTCDTATAEPDCDPGHDMPEHKKAARSAPQDP
nr:MAG TPA: antitoxin [Caudoviricetes sp.]